MKSGIVIPLIVFLTVGLFSANESCGQGFSGVLNKLDNIDARLNELEQKIGELQNLRSQISDIPLDEMAEIGNTISTLRKEIDRIKGSESPELTGMPELRQSLDALRSDVDALERGGNQPEHVEYLANDLRGLVLELRNTFAGESRELTVGEDIPLQISGFGDVFAVTRQGGTSDDFQLGQVEVDLETDIDEKIVIGAAIAYDAEAENFGLGAFTVDFHLWDSEGGHFQPVNGIDHSGIIAGQFDVPFGIDWHVYPSIDRKLVSAPLVVENTHDGWNDYGLMGYMENPYFNAVVYGANGFGYENGVDLFGDPIVVPMNFSVGGRAGITPNKHVEVGGSYAGFFNEANKIDMSLAGADLQINFHQLSVKGEYITHSIGMESGLDMTNTGYYAQGMFEFGRYFLVGRYGVFSLDENGIDDLTRLSVGAGWSPLESFGLRYEYQYNSEDADDASFFQLVVAF